MTLPPSPRRPPGGSGGDPDESRKTFRSARSALQGKATHVRWGPSEFLPCCRHAASAFPSDTRSGAGRVDRTPRPGPIHRRTLHATLVNGRTAS